MNTIVFAAGLVMTTTTVALVFLAPYNPKELGFWPMVSLIFGVDLIVA
jgi:hypothetical protein